ncbi:MAG: hypothetical protein LW595_05840 [Rickettsiales bacterium]|jgi:hypothetical protein|nr:hypothetical protein [Rickettsiales bacterium]
MKIYSYRKDQDRHTAFITYYNNLYYTACTFTESKDFKTLEGAKKWMAKRGFVNILEIEIIAE